MSPSDTLHTQENIQHLHKETKKRICGKRLDAVIVRNDRLRIPRGVEAELKLKKEEKEKLYLTSSAEENDPKRRARKKSSGELVIAQTALGHAKIPIEPSGQGEPVEMKSSGEAGRSLDDARLRPSNFNDPSR